MPYLRVEIALANVEHDSMMTFAIARSGEPGSCLVLGAATLDAVRRMIGGLPTVLVHREPSGDLRTYGRGDLTALVVGLDLDAHLWARFELDLGEAGDVARAA